MAKEAISDVDYLYKETYDNDLGESATRFHPTLNMLSKKPGFNGTTHKYSVEFGNPQGIGATVALAQAACGAGKGAQFEMARKFRFGICRLDGDAMSASEGSDGALLELLERRMASMLDELGDANAFDFMAGEGNGIRGQRTSIATNVITLTGAKTARNFKVGMTLGASANADGSSPRTGTAIVTAVDISGNTVTVDNAAGIASFGNDDYLFRNGDPGRCFTGYNQIIPLDAPVFGVDSFRNEDRGRYPELLAGSRLTDAGYLPEDAAGLIATMISSNAKKKPTHACVNPLVFHNIARRANAKREYMEGSNAKIGFESITVMTAGGALKMYPDPDQPLTSGKVLTLNTWEWKHLEGYIHVIQKDGLVSMRLSDDDGVEIRHKSAGDVKCCDPAANGQFAVAA